MGRFRLLHSLRSQIALMLLLQFCLFSALIGFTLYELNLRKHDYVILNLAGQLRVLSQQMNNLSLVYSEQQRLQLANHKAHAEKFNTEIRKTIKEYNTIIHSFQERKLSPELTGRSDALYCSWDKRSLNQLDSTAMTWIEFRDDLLTDLDNPSLANNPIRAAQYILDHQVELLHGSTNLSYAFRLMMEDKLALIARLNKFAIALMAITALGLIALLLRKVFSPLKETIKGFEKIAQGDFDHQLPVSVQNEIGDLISSFNQLSKRLSGLFKLTQRINMATTPQENFAFLSDEFSSFLPFEWVGMTCVNALSKMQLHYQYSNGVMMLPEKTEFQISEKELVKAVLRQRPVIIQDVDELDDNDEFIHTLRNTNLRSLIILPLNLRNMEGAMLLFASVYPNAYSQDHIELMSNIALMLTHSFEKARNIESIMTMRDHALGETRAKNEFLSNISHEIRTPLTAISGYTELLLDCMDDDKDSKYNKELEHINLSVQHLLNLTGNILDLSKIEAEKMELYLEESSLSMLLDIASVIAQPLIEKNNNRFYCHFPEKEIKLFIDQTRFNQALLNLLSNAAKFTKNGAISVRSECVIIHGKEYVNIHVEDSGIGLSKEQIGRLFKDYTQADASISSRFGGTGLGLSLSKRLLYMMEGEIYVQSQFGTGSCFTIQLPVFAADMGIHQAGHA